MRNTKLHEIIFYEDSGARCSVLNYYKEEKLVMSVELNGIKWTTWDNVRKEMFTEEEIAESDLRVALIGELIKARRERGISQREPGKMSGVK